nr:relaxase/mobilization nuclease domain-containing protein [Mediterraneibacter glycyrrhizinilyticus]
MASAIHRSRTNLHVHFIMNSVNMKNGKHFHLTKQEFDSFMYNIGELLSIKDIALKGYTYYDESGRMHRGESSSPFLYPHKQPRY